MTGTRRPTHPGSFITELTKLTWTQKVNTDELTAFSAAGGVYQLQGKGREYGGGIRRDWSLSRGGRHMSNPTRKVEGQGFAQQDLRQMVRTVLQAAYDGFLYERPDGIRVQRLDAQPWLLDWKVPGFVITLLTDDRPLIVSARQHKMGITQDGRDALNFLRHLTGHPALEAK